MAPEIDYHPGMARRSLVSPAAAVPALVALSACLATTRDGCKNKDHAAVLRPARLEAETALPADPPRRTLRVAVYADQDYRASTLHWKAQFRTQLERASDALLHHFGVRLEAVEMSPWERQAPSLTLGGPLGELKELDPARDVDLVIGLVTPLPEVYWRAHALGAASLLGRHMVVRGMQDLVEHRVLGRWQRLSEEERERLYLSRKRYREVVVILHEWGHLMGAIHCRDRRFFMNVDMAHRAAGFLEANGTLIRLSLAHKPRVGATAGEQAAFRQRIRQAVLDLDPREWVPSERQATLSRLSPEPAGEAADPQQPDDGKPHDCVPSPADPAGLGEALARVEALAAANPGVASVEVRLCSLRTRALRPDAGAACERALELAPRNPRAHLQAAASRYVTPGAGSPSAAARAATALLDGLPADDVPPDVWVYLARVLASIEAVTLAEQATAGVGHIEGAAEVRSWARGAHRRLGLPVGNTVVGPEEEPAYAGLMRTAWKDLEARLYQRALATADGMLQRWPSAPGPLAIRCEASVWLGRLAEARQACAATLAVHEESTTALFHLGHLEMQRGRTAEGIRRLELVVELDPTLQPAWAALGRALLQAGRRSAWEGLDRRHRERFGEPLPGQPVPGGP